jgi:hypothetical protein
VCFGLAGWSDAGVVVSACVGGCGGVLGCCPCVGWRLAAPGGWVGVRECVLGSGGHGARRRSRAVPHLADVQSEGHGDGFLLSSGSHCALPASGAMLGVRIFVWISEVLLF